MLTPLLAKGQDQVPKAGLETLVKIEKIVAGHLTDINGKYKLRVTQTTYDPGGFISEHDHVGPGIRYVVSGQLTHTQNDTTRVYNAGDYFYESGDISHRIYNQAKNLIVSLSFDLL